MRLNNPSIIRKLLVEANLDLRKAIDIAQATEQPGMPTSCTRRKLQSLPTNFVLKHRVQTSMVDLRRTAASHAIAVEARTIVRKIVLTRTPLVTTATRLDTSMGPAARNVLTRTALRHNEQPRRKRLKLKRIYRTFGKSSFGAITYIPFG